MLIVEKLSCLLASAALILFVPGSTRPYHWSGPETVSTSRPGSSLARHETHDPTEWLKGNAVTLKSTTPGTGISDLQRLKSVLAGVKVIGLGEATHGTKEFASVKHRILEFLVTELDFNVFALEANYATCLEINRYVLGANVDRNALLEDVFDIWRTEEVMELIEWIRKYNRSVPNAKKVRFYGFDIQEILQARAIVVDYLREVGAPEERVRGTREVVRKLWGVLEAAPAYGAGRALFSLLPNLEDLIGYFSLNEKIFIKRSSRRRYEDARQHLRLLFQYADSFIEDNDKRDRYMAENLLYILKHERPGARMVVWAHNIHISMGEYYITGRGHNMGYYMREALGPAYYAIGFVFGQGSFQALAGTYKTPGPRGLITHMIGPPPANSLDWYMARPAIGSYLIDFRLAPKDESLRQWLDTTLGMRQAGGDKVPANLAELWEIGKELFPIRISTDYDGLIFVREITSAEQISLKR